MSEPVSGVGQSEEADGYIRTDPAPFSTNQIFGTRVVRTTPSGKSVEYNELVSHLLISSRLPVDQFKPRRDQRQAINRWNKFVLGDEYVKESARLHPRSKEEKARRNDFDLVAAVHESEFVSLKKYVCVYPNLSWLRHFAPSTLDG